MAQKTIAQQAVAIFMQGSLAEAQQILEIGQAIVENRLAAGVTLSMTVPVAPARRKPGPKASAAVPAAPVATPPIPSAAPARRRGRPPGSGSGPVGVVPPAASASDVAGGVPTRRRGRPPVTPAAPAAPAAAEEAAPTPLAGFTELPPQGDPGDE